MQLNYKHCNSIEEAEAYLGVSLPRTLVEVGGSSETLQTIGNGQEPSVSSVFTASDLATKTQDELAEILLASPLNPLAQMPDFSDETYDRMEKMGWL